MCCHSFQSIDGGSAVDTIGIFVTGSEVSCSVPNITTERPAIRRQGISVANYGTLYSNVLEFVTFDSVCMSCGQDKVCTQKVDHFHFSFWFDNVRAFNAYPLLKLLSYLLFTKSQHCWNLFH